MTVGGWSEYLEDDGTDKTQMISKGGLITMLR